MLGYEPIPCRGEIPVFKHWQDIRIDADHIIAWGEDYSDAFNTGIRTRYCPAIDIDVYDAEMVKKMRQKILGFISAGTLLERIGQPPKILIPFHSDVPFDKIATTFKSPDGKVHKVEVLCDGQQFIADGIHPDTSKPYQWKDGIDLSSVPRKQLPIMDEALARQIIDCAATIMRESGWIELGTAKAIKINGSKSPWAQAALDGECDKVRNAARGMRNDTLNAAAFSLGQIISGGELDKVEVEQRLFQAARGLVDDDGKSSVSATINSGITAGMKYPRGTPNDNTETGHNDNNDDTKTDQKTKLMQSSAEFVTNFKPPDYLIDGFLQRRYVYSMTGQTGAGKTTVALLIAAHVALGRTLDGKDIEKGKVLIFAGENPDDVCTRWIKLCEALKTDPVEMDVIFLPGTPDIFSTEIRSQIDREANEHGPFALVIIDTSAAYYIGNDENDNVQLGKHARMLRTLVDLPGGPTILVTCHPTKTPNMENLLPRGGGAFLAEVDGNLACVSERGSMVVEITTHGKFRGPEFSPFSFRLVAGTSDKLIDSKGRSIWTVYAEAISTAEHDEITQTKVVEQNSLLRAIMDNPEFSNSQLADHLLWSMNDGSPYKTKVRRMVAEFVKAGLLVNDQRPYVLTKKGQEKFKKVAGNTET
jgi:hypothetical protein